MNPRKIGLSPSRITLLGTGAAAVTALWDLAAAGAHVRWYVDRADVGNEAILARGLASRAGGSLELTFDDPRSAPLGGAVVTARGDDLDRDIAERARASRVPVHVVDRPELSTVTLADIGAARTSVARAPSGSAAPAALAATAPAGLP
jgi:siroheme synthase (precorrin-2 oxidase/ferrochelatase)